MGKYRTRGKTSVLSEILKHKQLEVSIRKAHLGQNDEVDDNRIADAETCVLHAQNPFATAQVKALGKHKAEVLGRIRNKVATENITTDDPNISETNNLQTELQQKLDVGDDYRRKRSRVDDDS